MSKPRLIAQALAITLGLGSTLSLEAAVDGTVHQQDPYENLLVSALDKIATGELDEAIRSVEDLISSKPNFKLAQMVYGDLLMAKSNGITGFGTPEKSKEAIQDLMDEAKARWSHFDQHPQEGLVPKYLLALEEKQKKVIVVDTKRSRLFLYENKSGKPELLEDFYISIGKNGAVKWKEGDKRTPVGVYFVTEFLDPSSLPDYYGTGAYPIDYPNPWDKRLGRTGYGIWIHGNPLQSFSRAPRASDGCVTIPNQHFDLLKQHVDINNTPVIIADGIEWAAQTEVEKLESELKQRLLDWEKDWESRDANRYLNYYSQDFKAGRVSYEKWAQHKRKVNEGKDFIAVELSDLSMFVYPGESDLVVVKFRQNYNSNNYKSDNRKQQYWKREKGVWKIVYEGPSA
ncbi:MAG: L,D-transpeptidase family protein [Gammaproteobacteria bacterium]|nr:L,D-transpeptidase family protein [Gammaproteobacteria bacterium]